LINVTVTDPLNRFVTGLEKENFRLFEDKIEQKISHFASEDAPLSIGLVFDTSGSMGNKLTKSREAVAHFFKTANPEDEFFLVEFNDRPELVVDFTTNLESIQNHLTFTQSKGRTALLDAVYLALHKMKKAHNPRKALLIISDGGDNSSRYTESEIKNLVRGGRPDLCDWYFRACLFARQDGRRNERARPAQRDGGTDRRTSLRGG
jgi:VWFA-related protein